MLNHELPGGDVVEMGGEWIGPAQLRINKLVAELGIETFPTHNAGEHLLDLHGRTKRYTGEIPPLAKAALVDLGQSQLRFDRLAKRVPLEAPWAADRAARWDEETFATWVRRNTKTASARFFWEVFSEAVFAAEPQDMSLLHALAYTHSGGGVNSLIGVRNAAQQDRLVGGSQLVAQRLAESFGDELVLGAPVRRIAQRADRVTVEADGMTVRARRVIVSIPPVLAGPHRVRAGVAAAARPPDPEDAGRLGHQGERRLRRALLARRRLDRSGRGRPRADPLHVRQLAAVGQPRRAGVLPRRRAGSALRAGRRGRAPACRCSRRSRGTSVRGRASRST